MTARTAMNTPASLKPGHAPARLLLRIWRASPLGSLALPWPPSKARARLLALGYLEICETGHLLTPAGRKVAEALEAGS